jgi:protein-disulfide isomerase/uncharacterized membrane protein
MQSQSAGAIDICTAVFGTGCDEALRSEGSWILGIPLAGWALVYYATLVCLLILARALGEAFEHEATLGALLLTVVGAAVSVGLAVVLLAGWEPFCPLCLVVHGLNLLLVLTVRWTAGRTVREHLQALRAAGRYLLGAQPKQPAEAAWKVVGFVTAALVAAVAYQWIYVEAAVRKAMAENELSAPQVIARYGSQPKRDIPVGNDDAQLGPAHAPVRLVVFSDFQCSACRSFANELIYLRGHFGGKLSVVFKHYPLSTECNPNAKIDRHPRSCPMALAAAPARRQGKFWPFHDAAFAADSAFSEKTIQQIAAKLPLDVHQFAADRTSDDARQKVAADIELGTRLKIRGTPTVLLNGRIVSPLIPGSLDILIHHELDEPAH